MRAEPSHRAEQASQMLFGEKAEVLAAENGDWLRIRSAIDDYEGWCKRSQVQLISFQEYRKTATYFSGRDNSKLVTDQGEIWLPLGSELYGLRRSQITVLNLTGRFKGKRFAVKKREFTPEMIAHWATQYLNAPYQWGGRSSAGIDCSGLSQMVFKLCGISLPRDAKDQAKTGKSVDFLQDSQYGDLAFFDNEEGRINHVGILVGPNEIVHATDTAGRVVMDRIDSGGIISTAHRKRTHNLRLIKRYV